MAYYRGKFQSRNNSVRNINHNQNAENRKWALPRNNSASSSTTINNTNRNPHSFGLTSPISLTEPTINELRRTNELKEILNHHNIFESEQELNQRTEVINKLDILFKQWVRDTCIKKGVLESVADNAGGKVHVFGSCKLGVNDKGADIDSLCVAPWYVERKDYFTSFYNLLKSQPNVVDLRAIEEAYVPVIKMKFNNVEVDMLFARLDLESVPDSLLLSDNKLLKYLDQKCIRSLNGCRVTDEIMRLVPNKENFRLTLRAVKLWAKNKGIYNNSLGYLGGVSWALLVARACQLYPNAVPSTLIEKFFRIFSLWTWPLPMLLKQPENVDLGFKVWDPRIHLEDRNHLMPIITPAYPQQNSTFNVSVSTRTIIQKEIENGLAVAREINNDKATWDKLFEPTNFFDKYKHYVILSANSDTAEDQLQWSGLIQAKIRLLIKSLEKNQNISLAHINPQEFSSLTPQLGKHVSTWFIGLQFEEKKNLNLNLTREVEDFINTVTEQAEEIKLLKNGMTIKINYEKKKNLSDYITHPLIKTHPLKENLNIIRNRGIPSNNQNNSRQIKRKLEDSCDNINKRQKLMIASSNNIVLT